MDATITMKITPREFDLLRAAVIDSQEDARQIVSKRSDVSPREKNDARTREAEYAKLTQKMH